MVGSDVYFRKIISLTAGWNGSGGMGRSMKEPKYPRQKFGSYRNEVGDGEERPQEIT